jgi:glutathione synthase/RimK-type ligase-like ATP-grasp enzyme
MPDVAVVTAAVARGLDDDLPLLEGALRGRGVAHRVVDWDDPSVRWEEMALVVVRSAWDYVRRPERFRRWAEAVAAVAPLRNPPDALRWSGDKRYLAELEAGGVPVVPTAFAAPGEAMDWPAAGEVVVKPAVSAGTLDTARYGPRAREQARAHVARLHRAGRVAMAQPYLAAVEGARAETGLVFIGGRFSHAVRKGPMLVPGKRVVADLFVEEEIAPADPTAAELDVAARALRAAPGGGAGLLYARVDLIPDDDGAPRVLEVELVEPSLFLGRHPAAADRLAETIGALVRPAAPR